MVTVLTPHMLGVKSKCWYCGQHETCTRDHFYPISRGGRLKVWACELCQRTKAHRTPLEWIAYIAGHGAIDNAARGRIIQNTIRLWNEIEDSVKVLENMAPRLKMPPNAKSWV